MRLSLTSLLLVLALPACTSLDDSGPSGPIGKVDGLGGTISVTLAQADAFYESSPRHASVLHYGFTDQLEKGWTLAKSIEIEYENHSSKPIIVEVSEEQAGYLAFAIESQRPGYADVWSDDQFVDLSAPDGTLVELPIGNGASYPFASECYSIAVQNLDNNGSSYTFDGVLTSVFYGFTDASRTEYEEGNDVAWQDEEGKPLAAGELHVALEHDGGYKGSYYMPTEWVWVPEGLNLVFKLGLNRYSGRCEYDDDTKFQEHTETQTYFREIL